MGSHVLDVARFLFGEAEAVHCRTARVHAHIQGEDVATVVLHMRSGATVVVELGYPGTPYERERFPETFVFVEGEKGSVELAGDFWIRTTTAEGTLARRHPPPRFAWADPALRRRARERRALQRRTCWRRCAARAARRRPARTT